MKNKKIKEMSSQELEKELVELKSELFKLRFSLATSGLDNPLKVREVRKEIARVKTVLRQRELNIDTSSEKPVEENKETVKEKKVEKSKKKEENKKEDTKTEKTETKKSKVTSKK